MILGEDVSRHLSEKDIWGRADSEERVFRDSSDHWWKKEEAAQALAQTPREQLAGQRVATLIETPSLSALTSLAVLTCGSCLPLNPNWTPIEVRRVLNEFDILSVILEKGSPWERELSDFTQITVAVSHKSLAWHCPSDLGHPLEDDFSLILLTSGTTGLPKAIPLTSQQLLTACDIIGDSLELSPADTCLNFLPMMHIGGLLDQFLAPIRAGGKVVFAEANDANKCLQLSDELGITWIQGAPAMLQHLLRAKKEPGSNLRFVRSVSAPLPVELLEEIEKNFQAPVIEIYGMSETTGVITSNPLPPAERKPGSVGKAVGIDLEIRGAEANSATNPGSIWVKGSRVLHHYLSKGETTDSFAQGWFSTGDQGYLDEDGFLFITGRTKELINRGGQKFSPHELDQMVQSWSEIEEAAVFSFCHATLGEEVALAVVLSPKQDLEAEEILTRLKSAVASYKLPRKIHFLASLPRNENGKLQRHQLQELCSTPASVGSTGALSDREKRLVQLWKANLSLDEIGLEEDYFEAGGDSLSMTSLILAMEKEFAIKLDAVSFFDHSTVSSQAELLANFQSPAERRTLVKKVELAPELTSQLKKALQSWDGIPSFANSYSIQADNKPKDSKLLFVWCANGQTEWAAIKQAIDDRCKLIGFRSLFVIQDKRQRNLNELCDAYLEDIEQAHPIGDIVVGGFCAGAHIMEEIAKRLLEKGRKVNAFIAHDYIPSAPLPTYHAIISSQDWQRNPFQQFPQMAQGWNRLLGDQWQVCATSGLHSDYTRKDFLTQFESFVRSQLDQIEFVSEQPQPQLLRPNYQLALRSSLPPLLKFAKDYPLELSLTNTGEQPFESDQGLALHARWISPAGKVRYRQPMLVALPQSLPPGETTNLTLNIRPAKRFRLEHLEIALLEEGLDWVFSCYQPHVTIRKTVLTY